jgi:hypothetical protein
MFDTYITKKEDRLVPYEKTVTEIKAPTDESIKLLNEWKDKLMEQIVGVYRVENCPMDMVAVQSVNPATRETLLAIKTTVNGKEYHHHYSINEELLSVKPFAEILRDKFQEIVTEHVGDIVQDTLIKFVVRGHLTPTSEGKEEK